MNSNLEEVAEKHSSSEVISQELSPRNFRQSKAFIVGCVVLIVFVLLIIAALLFKPFSSHEPSLSVNTSPVQIESTSGGTIFSTKSLLGENVNSLQDDKQRGDTKITLGNFSVTLPLSSTHEKLKSTIQPGDGGETINSDGTTSPVTCSKVAGIEYLYDRDNISTTGIKAWNTTKLSFISSEVEKSFNSSLFQLEDNLNNASVEPVLSNRLLSQPFRTDIDGFMFCGGYFSYPIKVQRIQHLEAQVWYIEAFEGHDLFFRPVRKLIIKHNNSWLFIEDLYAATTVDDEQTVNFQSLQELASSCALYYADKWQLDLKSINNDQVTCLAGAWHEEFADAQKNQHWVENVLNTLTLPLDSNP